MPEARPFGGDASAPPRPRAPWPLVFLAAATVLLPAHPSLQTLLHRVGIPAALVSAACGFPVLCLLTLRPLVDRQAVLIAGFFGLYVLWMSLRALTSPAIGMPDQLASLRSLLVLMPLALSAALVASSNLPAAAGSVAFLGGIAVAHFSFLLLRGADSVVTSGGFRDLSGGDASANYQATSFYFGLVGAALAVHGVHGGRVGRWIALAAMLLLIGLMASVGARASLVALVAVLLALLLLTGPVRTALFLMGACVLAVAVVLSADALGILSIQTLTESLVAVQRFNMLLEGGDPSRRVGLFTAALRLWSDSPITLVIGAGLGYFPLFLGMGNGWYPHNFVLETLAEGGVVGLIPLVPVISMVLRRFTREARRGAGGPRYLGALAVYAVLAYQAMGGIESLWIPSFFMALFLFATPSPETNHFAASLPYRRRNLPTPVT